MESSLEAKGAINNVRLSEEKHFKEVLKNRDQSKELIKLSIGVNRGGGVDSSVINNNCNVQVIQLYLAIYQRTLLPYNHLKKQWTQVLMMAMDTLEVNSQFHYHHYFCFLFLSRLVQGLPHVREAVARKFSVVNKAPLTVEVRIFSPSSFLISLLLITTFPPF